MSTDPPPDGIKLPKKRTGVCQVCGDNASIINYGALSCLSCRTFFRRNGFYTKVYIEKDKTKLEISLFSV
jgi:hypothetical protein